MPRLGVKRRAPILVTGAHRSGTTWVGKMLALTARTYYVDEALRPDRQLLDPGVVHYWYPYITSDNGHLFRGSLERILSLDFSTPYRRWWSKHLPSRLEILKRTRRWVGIPRPIWKDPFASLSVEWLAEAFQMDIVCLIRHPAGVVASLKRADWHFDFQNLINQPQLMETWLYPYAAQIENVRDDIVEEGALVWLCVNHVLCACSEHHPDWLFWRLEDISQDPVAAFGSTYERLGVPYSNRTQERIVAFSGAPNPTEAPGNELHVIRRNSRALMGLWHIQLSPEEISRIRRIVEPVSCRYYTDAEW
jgi:hypothetical protein